MLNSGIFLNLIKTKKQKNILIINTLILIASLALSPNISTIQAENNFSSNLTENTDSSIDSQVEEENQKLSIEQNTLKENSFQNNNTTITVQLLASSSITISGTFWYLEDSNNAPMPMRRMHVYLMDDDTLVNGGDETVADQWTDDNGHFSFTVNNDDGWFQGGRDPFVIVYAENPRAACYSRHL